MVKTQRDPVRRMLAGALVAGVALTGLPAGAAQAGPPGARADGTSAVQWGECDGTSLSGVPEDQRGQYSCATYRVPLDHDNAAAGTIDLALMRRAARTPEARIGSLFLNPGGPGGAGKTMPVLAEEFFEAGVLDRFDIVGFDPRGVGESKPVHCFTTDEDAREVFESQVAVPLSKEQISTALTAYRNYGELCKRNSGELLNHMSTKDVARDLDLLRAAVGDERLNYVGFSYGTLLGATYANMFPKRTRAMVLDGNVDPALRTSDGLAYDRQRAAGFESVLDAFLDECERVREQCAFSEGRPRQKFEELRDLLRQKAIELPDGGSVDMNAFIGGVAGALYTTDSFAGLAQDLQDLYTAVHPPEGAKHSLGRGDLDTLLNPRQGGRFDVLPDTPYTTDDSYFGVNCLDKPFSHGQDDIPAIAAEWERESPTFGRLQAFGDAAGCTVWPARGQDVYRGPWNRSTEHPVLVLGSYHDPATQYAFSKRMADQLGYARLVSVDAFGHCVLGDSAAVDKAATAYLTDLTVPPPDQVLEPDRHPFDPPA